MPQCMGIKSDGDRCTRQDTGFIHFDAPHLHFCTTHWTVYDRRVEIRRRLTVVVAEQHHRNGTCHKWVAGERWCGRLCPGNDLLCITHVANAQLAEERRHQRLEERQQATALYMFYRGQERLMPWREMVDHIVLNRPEATLDMRHNVALRYFMIARHDEAGFPDRFHFEDYWRWVVDGRHGPAPVVQPPLIRPPIVRNELARIAADGQNVHTRHIAEQTNKGLEKLLDAAKDIKSMRSPDWFAAKWLPRSYGRWTRVARIVSDMLLWYDRSYCKTEGDWLYRRALDGLYVTLRNIKDFDLQNELYKRAFEECEESINMCCEGHISRLCNVLVGFDDAFDPPVPFGEILQNKMAAIYAMDIATEEKIRQAVAFFNEFAVPEPERIAWLEAF